MTTQINGSTGVSLVQAGVVVQADLASNVAGNGPVFSAWQSVTQSITSTMSKLLFQSVEFDTNNNFANSRFTPTVAGYYTITASLTFATASSLISLAAYKNGALYRYIGNTYSSTGQLAMGSCMVYLNGTTDYVEIFGYSAATLNSSNNQSQTYFQGFLARAA